MEKFRLLYYLPTHTSPEPHLTVSLLDSDVYNFCFSLYFIYNEVYNCITFYEF
jgi:hypothetical protein